MSTAQSSGRPVETLLVAVPETAGSALYGMHDVLCAAGSVWQTLMRTQTATRFQVRIAAPSRAPFKCGFGVPVEPAVGFQEDPDAQIVIVPELWLGPDEDPRERYPTLVDWLRRRYAAGAHLYSACSGALLLAATGLLDGREATSHWGYQDLFRDRYPQIRFRPEPNLCFADSRGRIVTAGGTTSWHDLALHVIARHASPGEALRIAKVYLMKWHDDGQLPYEPLIRKQPHSDAVVEACEAWLAEHFRESVGRAVVQAKIPERTLKRRFKAATGLSLLDYLQNVRIEAAKRLLETTDCAVDEISHDVGYEDASFFRRLFRRRTGVAPAQYRRVFKPIAAGRPLANTPAARRPRA